MGECRARISTPTEILMNDSGKPATIFVPLSDIEIPASFRKPTASASQA